MDKKWIKRVADEIRAEIQKIPDALDRRYAPKAVLHDLAEELEVFCCTDEYCNSDL